MKFILTRTPEKFQTLNKLFEIISNIGTCLIVAESEKQAMDFYVGWQSTRKRFVTGGKASLVDRTIYLAVGEILIGFEPDALCRRYYGVCALKRDGVYRSLFSARRSIIRR